MQEIRIIIKDKISIKVKIRVCEYGLKLKNIMNELRNSDFKIVSYMMVIIYGTIFLRFWTGVSNLCLLFVNGNLHKAKDSCYGFIAYDVLILL